MGLGKTIQMIAFLAGLNISNLRSHVTRYGLLKIDKIFSIIIMFLLPAESLVWVLCLWCALPL
jgi:SNF2 family DNA or RNA helicase